VSESIKKGAHLKPNHRYFSDLGKEKARMEKMSGVAVK
jgi:hypothetical protein